MKRAVVALALVAGAAPAGFAVAAEAEPTQRAADARASAPASHVYVQEQGYVAQTAKPTPRPVPAGSEVEPDDPLRMRFAFGLALGASMVDPDGVNELFANYGYPTFRATRGAMGLDAMLMVERVVIALDFIAHPDPVDADDLDATSQMSATQLGLRLGYALLATDWAASGLSDLDVNLRVYPMAGLSLSMVEVQGAGTSAVPATAGDLLASPTRTLPFRHTGGQAQLGLGMDVAFGRSDELVDPEWFGLALGFRGGYQFDLGRSEWEIEDIALGDSPDFEFAGPFFRIVLSMFVGND